MALNNPYAPGATRQPRLQILCKGQPVGGALSFLVHNNNYYNSDTFTARFALNADPNYGIQWWGAQENPLLLDIQASVDGGQTWTSLILGQVDHIQIHLEKGLCEVDGRDMTANFIDTKTQQTYQNLTASQIVEKLAGEHGMTADVTPTTTLVGRYYEIDHERIGAGEFTRTTTEWNLMCSFAQKEGFDIWVTGTTVHFHPTVPEDPNPFVVLWDQGRFFSNAIEITVDRALTFAKDIIVVVQSWDSRTGKSVTKYAPSGARAAAVASGKAQQFTYVHPNMSEAEAQVEANRIREDLTKHERLLEFSVPADLMVTARNQVSLQGTGSSWDQPYFIDNISRSMSWDEGFIQRIKAKNHSPVSTVLAS